MMGGYSGGTSGGRKRRKERGVGKGNWKRGRKWFALLDGDGDVVARSEHRGGLEKLREEWKGCGVMTIVQVKGKREVE